MLELQVADFEQHRLESERSAGLESEQRRQESEQRSVHVQRWGAPPSPQWLSFAFPLSIFLWRPWLQVTGAARLYMIRDENFKLSMVSVRNHLRHHSTRLADFLLEH